MESNINFDYDEEFKRRVINNIGWFMTAQDIIDMCDDE